MPALKMKAKPNKDFLREGQTLHPCGRLTKMSKGSHFQAKKYSQEAVLETCTTQDPQDVLSNGEVSGQKIQTAEAVDHELLHGASSQFLKWPLSSSKSTSVGRMGSQSASCAPILETIFSPTFEHGEMEHETISHDNADEQPDLPRLVADESDDGSCSSSDYQACDISDYCTSDLSTPLSFGGDLGFSNVIADTCPDYELINSELMFDVAERYMILPFIDSTSEISDVHDKDSVEEAGINSEDACLYLAVHQIKSSQDISYHSGDMEELDSFDPQLFIRNLPDLSEAVSSLWPVWLPKETQQRKAITLVLDLDETLVHSTLEHCADADFTFLVFFNTKEHTVYVRQRPYLRIFLEKVAQVFEIIVFTASQSIYAEQLLDILDPDKKLISQRIYRESCIFSEGSYMKDLTILGVDLAKVAIIDNSPQVFRLQLNNGIPITSWFDDPSDCALISLLPFLETLVDADDVRPIIAKKFNNKE